VIHTHPTTRPSLLEIVQGIEPRPEVLLVPFEADHRGQPVVVLAVLERTAVAYPAGTAGDPDDRFLARLAEVTVDPGRLRWRESMRGRRRSGTGMHLHQQPRRCQGCGRTAAQTRFSDDLATYCVPCSKERQREWGGRGPSPSRPPFTGHIHH
jgi:hypothetical protein